MVHTVQKKVTKWLQKSSTDDVRFTADDNYKGDDRKKVPVHGSFYYSSSAYQWLISRLRSQGRCTLAEAHAMSRISKVY